MCVAIDVIITSLLDISIGLLMSNLKDTCTICCMLQYLALKVLPVLSEITHIRLDTTYEKLLLMCSSPTVIRL